jgi:hypothetical protein
MGLPENTTCSITFDASFVHVSETAPDPGEPIEG